MITIQEAREKTASSQEAMSILIEAIGTHIDSAARNNVRKIVLDDCFSLPEFKPEQNSYSYLNFGSPMIRAIQTALQPYGFVIVMERIEHTVGGGFKSMDEESREEVWQHYVIKW